MKILYLLFTFLFLAFLSEPGNAQRRCRQRRGICRPRPCPPENFSLGRLDCQMGQMCCRRRFGK
uniref:Beta-defensin-like protein n=1 Tax=Bothrops mattogrossensis TaxID=1171125 RepID=M1KKQ8_BOTMT|nr:beta-defensin-like protein [Bothrops matogrossensis]